MLYHYAITPEVFEPSAINEMKPAGVVLVELIRGICENGLLADLNAGHWMTRVRSQQKLADIPPAVRDRVESCLNVLHNRNRLIRHPAGSKSHEADEFRWLRWSLERHQANSLSGIFSSDDYIAMSGLTDEILVKLSMALDADCWTGRKRSVRFAKTESHLRSCLGPLLRYAQKLTLIDPYMTCRESRFFNTVQHCADLLGNHDGRVSPGVIHIHAGDPETVGPDEHHESKSDRLDRWKRELGPVARHWGHCFRVLLWKRKRGGASFHDRYLITDQCGVDVPGGLDFVPDVDEDRANSTTCSVLEAEQINAILLDEFHHHKSPYEYLGSISVSP
jgi:hypothetical protein